MKNKNNQAILKYAIKHNFMRDFSSEFHLSENLVQNIVIPEFISLYDTSIEMANALELYQKKDFTSVLNILHNSTCINAITLRAYTYFSLSSYQNTLSNIREVIKIAGSFHSFFHYFGFNISCNLFYITYMVSGKADFYEARAKFLYKIGYEHSFTFKNLQDFEIDLLPGSTPLCIFKGSHSYQELAQCFEIYRRNPLESLIYFEKILKKATKNILDITFLCPACIIYMVYVFF